jgi:hypothetical protein
MVAGGEESEVTSLRPKNQPRIQSGAAFEIVFAKATNAQTRMEVGFPKTISDCIDCSRHFAPARFRKFPNIPPKGF